MAQINHYTTHEAEIAMAELKLFYLKRGKKIKSKVELLNIIANDFAKLLKQLYEDSINQLL